MNTKCPICDKKFNDEESWSGHVKEHESKSILNEPNFSRNVGASRARFSGKMSRIIENMSDLDRLNAEKILLNKKGKPRSDTMKWKTLAIQYPKIAESASERYKEKYPKTRNPVTIENFHDDEILLELVSKREPRKSKGKMAKIEEKIEMILAKIASFEERLERLEKQ